MLAQCRDATKALLRRASPRLWYRLQMRRRLKWPGIDPELAAMPRLVPKPGTCVDVGASEGLYSYVLAGLSRQVHAFEPIPELCRRLRAAVPANVTVHGVALSDRAGTTTLRLPGEDTGWATIEPANPLASAAPDRLRLLPIETRTLDSFGFKDVRLIKIDVEGHEAAVLAGAARTIAEERPVLVIEIEERHKPGGLALIRELLAGPGYAGWFLLGGQWRPVAAFVLDEHQNRGRPDRPYVHNFVFLPAEMAPPPPLAGATPASPRRQAAA